jgi:proton-translocating NADH-quinone oxidoreductase chain N
MTYFDIFQNNFKYILPELFFVSAILIILIYGTLYNASAYYKYPILTHSIGYLSIQSLLITLFLIINSPSAGPLSVVIFNNVLIIDDFTIFVKTIVLLGALATILISFNYTLNQKMSARINEYMVLILFSTLSMLLVISSFDLISMYLAIELQSLSFYVLAAFQRNNEFSTEAGLKYFILGAFTSGLLLFGESLIYGFTGLTNFEELTKLLAVLPETTNSGSNWSNICNGGTLTLTSNAVEGLSIFNLMYVEVVHIGLFFIIIAFLFKISAVPFHLWAPDVYEGAPTSVTAFFSITPKIAILALLLRLCMYTFYDLIEAWQNIIIFSSFLSMFIGTLGAINQNKIKRLFAYSSIAHVGYILISLATGTIESIEALLIYAVLYVFVITNTFSIILVMSKENFNINETENIQNIKYQPTINYMNNMTETYNNVNNYSYNNVQQQKNMQNTIIDSATLQETRLPINEIEEHINKKNNIKKNIPNLPQNLSFIKSKINEIWGEQEKKTEVATGATDATKRAELAPKAPQATQVERAEGQPGKEYKTKINYASLIQGNPLWNPYHSSKQTQRTQNKNYFKTSDIIPNNQIIPFNDIGPKEKKNNYIKHITDLSTLAKTNPILALTAATIFFSNAGIPPLAGFYGKLNVFLTAVENSMYFLALTGILCSVIGTFYSIRLVKIIYFHSISNTNWHFYQPISKENAIVLAITFFFTIFFFLAPSFLFITAHSAALSLCL